MSSSFRNFRDIIFCTTHKNNSILGGILCVNFVWDPQLDSKIDNEITTVEGGCSRYFHLKINLDTQKIYDLTVNEPGEVKYIQKVHKRRRIRY